MTPSGKLPAAAPEIKGADDPLVCEMILSASLASAHRALAAKYPDSAGGFNKMARKYSDRIAVLADHVAARARP